MKRKTDCKAVWEMGHADKGISCSCGFLPKRPKVLKNHIERRDPAGFARWRKDLWKSVGILKQMGGQV